MHSFTSLPLFPPSRTSSTSWFHFYISVSLYPWLGLISLSTVSPFSLCTSYLNGSIHCSSYCCSSTLCSFHWLPYAVMPRSISSEAKLVSVFDSIPIAYSLTIRSNEKIPRMRRVAGTHKRNKWARNESDARLSYMLVSGWKLKIERPLNFEQEKWNRRTRQGMDSFSHHDSEC